MSAILSVLKNAIPFKRQLRALKRAIIPYQSDPENDVDLLEQCLRMIAALHQAGAEFHGAALVEIGTGWVPILPLVFHMAGINEVVTVDQERLMDRHTFLNAISVIRNNWERLIAESAAPPHLFDLARLPSRGEPTIADLCRSAGISYRAPSDFMNLPPASTDLITSRTVLEHIPEHLLREIFRHAKVILRPGGFMCHVIDMSDHFEHKNKSLSRLDMLRYGDAEWAAKIKDPQDYQNRLRRPDFVRILEETGWQILSIDGTPHPEALRDLQTMKIAPRYAAIDQNELAILTSLVVAVPKP
jgi:SAM-dependent methyltransferase